MKFKDAKKEQLIDEINKLHRRIAELEKSLNESEAKIEEFQESEEKFRTLCNNTPDAIFVEDVNGKVLHANSAACRLHGVNAEDLIGKNVIDLIPPDQREKVIKTFPKWFTGEMNYNTGYTLDAKGYSIPVEIRANKIIYAKKKALLLVVRDITERKQAEEKLTREKEKLAVTLQYQHHEKLNGSGYPNALLKKDILLEARIISVADVIEAMSSHRPYRPALGLEIALAKSESSKRYFL